MISTYLPFLAPFFAPAFLGAAGPSRSSISLTLLILDAGLDGGPWPARRPPGPVILALLSIGGAPLPTPIGVLDIGPPSAGDDVRGVGGGPIAPLDALEGGPEDLGGGGVADDFGSSAGAPAALLTHLPRSLSKTNEFSSPSLALIGPVCGAFGSFLLQRPPMEGSQLPRCALLGAGLLAGFEC
jgi:hypothetical protein